MAVDLRFRELPGQHDDHPRPVIDVVLEGELTYACLLDTGALHNRFARWTADVAGIDLAGGERETLAVGGFLTEAVAVPVELEVAGLRWRAPVAFCDPWPLGFQLLGLEGFFRFFRVAVRAATYSLSLEPDPGE